MALPDLGPGIDTHIFNVETGLLWVHPDAEATVRECLADASIRLVGPTADARTSMVRYDVHGDRQRAGELLASDDRLRSTASEPS